MQVVIRLDADGHESWLRDFGGQRFRSRLTPARDGVVSERFGPFAFDLELQATPEALTMQVAGWRFWRIGLPLSWAPRSDAVESMDADGRFTFDVRLPFR